MKSARITAALEQMVTQPGIDGCALVDGVTGLVWQTAGAAPDAEWLWEAAVDYWRLYDRQSARFSALGPLGAAVMYHRAGVLAVLPCCTDPKLLIIAFGRHSGVDWITWQRRTRELGALVAASGEQSDESVATPATVS